MTALKCKSHRGCFYDNKTCVISLLKVAKFSERYKQPGLDLF